MTDETEPLICAASGDLAILHCSSTALPGLGKRSYASVATALVPRSCLDFSGRSRVSSCTSKLF